MLGPRDPGIDPGIGECAASISISAGRAGGALCRRTATGCTLLQTRPLLQLDASNSLFFHHNVATSGSSPTSGSKIVACAVSQCAARAPCRRSPILLSTAFASGWIKHCTHHTSAVQVYSNVWAFSAPQDTQPLRIHGDKKDALNAPFGLGSCTWCLFVFSLQSGRGGISGAARKAVRKAVQGGQENGSQRLLLGINAGSGDNREKAGSSWGADSARGTKGG